MNVILEAEIFRTDRVAEYHGDLLALFGDCVRGRHTIAIEPSGKDAYRQWIDGESSVTRNMCESVLQKSVKLRAQRPGAREIRIADVAIASWPDMRLPFSAALGILHRPLQLLLENGRNDANFLRVITRLAVEFDLAELFDSGVVEFQTKGGIDENRKWLETNGQIQTDACRMWVMCDSDAKQAWADASGPKVPERLGEGAKKLGAICKTHKIPIHILHRRAIDNYVPLTLLEQRSLQHEKQVDVYKSFVGLTDEQRHHYNMKKGFLQDEKNPEYDQNVGNLYDGIDPVDRLRLERGFNLGRLGVAALFEETQSNGQMKPLRVHEAWLFKDKPEAEARQIAEAIQELL